MYPNRAPRDVAAKDAPVVVAASAVPAPSVPGAGASPLASAVCSNLPARPPSPSLSGIEDSPDHENSDPEAVVPASWPKKTVKKFSPHSRMSSASKQSAAGLFRSLDNDMGLADKVDVVSCLLLPPLVRQRSRLWFPPPRRAHVLMIRGNLCWCARSGVLPRRTWARQVLPRSLP